MTTPVNSSNSNLPSFFSSFSSAAAQDLMTLQLTAGQLEPSGGTLTVTNPIIPDRTVAQRMGNFDPEIYDLREQSTLIKIMKVLLGGAGAGGLRKQSAIARLQNNFSGMHFLDLDRFYGALFGISRTAQESPPDTTFDPYHDATDPASWDDLQARDASYRDRLTKFAKSIYFGGSVAGITAMAESLIGSQVDVYESWEWVDEENADILVSSTLVYTYTFLAANVRTWLGLTGHTWADWGGGTLPFVGRTGQRNRSEFILQPHVSLTPDERYEILRVINTFKPAGTQFTINSSGLTTQTPITIRAVAADSEYWAIIPVTLPNPQLGKNLYAAGSGTLTQPVVQQRPAFSQFQGDDWSYNNDILNVTSYTINGAVTGTTTDDQTVVYSDSTTRTYVAAAAPMTGAQAISARIVSDGVLTATPYAPTRGSINTALVTT